MALKLKAGEEVESALTSFLERMCREWTLDCNFNEELCLRLLAASNFNRQAALAALKKKTQLCLKLVAERKISPHFVVYPSQKGRGRKIFKHFDA